jgi:hypothetical protein
LSLIVGLFIEAVMQTVHATFRDGVFAPDQMVAINEGTRVTLRVQPMIDSSESGSLPVEPIIEPEDQGAPFDLPMPLGGTRVAFRDGLALLPDPPLFYGLSTTE